MSRIAYKTSTVLCLMATMWLLFVFDCHRVVGAPHPIPPGLMYREDYDGHDSANIPSQSLVDRLNSIIEHKKEKIANEEVELAEEEMIMQNLMEEKARKEREQLQQQQQQQAQQEASSGEDSEALPAPAAIYRNGPLHSGKRTYMALCHFKICNMGRKRTN